MSVPSNLLYSNPAASEPLLSENQGSQSAVPARMSAKWTQEDPELVDFRVATSSFSSEPIHRFDHVPTATGAKTAKKRNVHSAASSGKFTGEVVDGDPEVEAFATRARVGGAALANYQAGGTRNGLTGKSSYSLSGVGGINSDPGDFVHYKHDQNRTKWEEAVLYVREGENNDKFLSHPTGKTSKLAYKILHHPAFHLFDLTLSILLMLLSLIETPAAVLSDKDEVPPIVRSHAVVEIMILLLLALDIVLRLIWFKPSYFLKHRRTMFITLMLCVMLVEAFVVLSRAESHIRVTRAIRPVFFIDTYLMHGVRRVLRQIFQSLKEIVDIILLLFFIVAFFSLFGYFLFAENDPTFFKSYGVSFISIFITLTTANNPDVMMEGYSKHPATPIFFIIYVITTVYFVSNVLLAVVYSNFATEEKDKFRKLFLHKREALRHAFTVLAGLNGIEFHDFLLFMQQYKPCIPEWQVMCVFKALHFNREVEHKELCLKEFYTFYEVQNLKWTQTSMSGKDFRWFERFPLPLHFVFEKIYLFVTWEWFNSIFHIVVLLNTLFLAIYSLTIHESHERFERLHIVYPVSFIFLFVYLVEISLKILAHGPLHYFTRFWNLWDFTLLSVSLIVMFLEINPHYHFLATVRPLKLIRLLRLKKRYRDIMNTLVILIPRLISIAFLLLVVYYFFAIIGMECFHGLVSRGCCKNASYNVETYYAGDTHNETVNVYYLNNFDNIIRSYVTLFTLMVVNNWYIIMEGFASEVEHHWIARVYFISFYIVTLIVLQVVISFTVEAFVLQLELNNKRKKSLKKISEGNPSLFDPDSVEDEKRKQEIRIVLVNEDLKKLRYETTYINEISSGFSCNDIIRRWRNISLHKLETVRFSGRRLTTAGDIYLWQFKGEIQTWIQEQDETFAKLESAPIPTPQPLREKTLNVTKNILRYFLE